MKFILSVCLSLLGSAVAFVPAAQQSNNAGALKMSEEVAAAEEVAVAPASSKVPCQPLTPLLGGSYFIGENYWDKLTSEYGSAATGDYLKAAELKHGRSAMIATLGFAFHKLGLTFNNISPHEYLSVTQGVKFADLQAMSPVDAIKAIPGEGMAQIFGFIALIELFELTHKDGAFVSGETVAPGLQPGGLTGDLGWNPLNIEITERRRLVEVQNGRAAMVAIFAWVCADAIPGSVPVLLPW